MGGSTKNKLWHSRLGHLLDKALQAIAAIDPLIVNDHSEPCDFCCFAKHRKLVFPLSHSISTKLFHLIHVDF